MPDKIRYRVRSPREVLGVSIEADPWPNIDTEFFDVYNNPQWPDGRDLLPVKVLDGNQARLATAQELADLPQRRLDDDNEIWRKAAKTNFETQLGPNIKIMRALVLVMKDEINILRALHSLPDRTNAQAKQAVLDKLNTGDAD